MRLKFYLVLSFPKITVCVATVMMLLRTATTVKLIKLPQRIDDRFDINKKPWKFCLGSFSNGKVIEP